MYKEFFGLCSAPFDLSTDPRFLYLSPEHARARAYLDYAVFKGDSLVVITGEIGAGKSTLIHDLTDRLDNDADVIVLHHPHNDSIEFLTAVLLKWGRTKPASTKPELLKQIKAELTAQFTWGKRTTLIVDEAQTLTRDVLEELRLLADQEINSEKPLGIVLIGQPNLNTTLAGREMEQLRQRVRLSFHLSPLNEHETKGYIERRLAVAGADNAKIFMHETIARIYKFTGGIPRLINVLADLALTAAWMDGSKQVTSMQVNEAIKELGWMPYNRRRQHLPAISTHANWGGHLRSAHDRAAQRVRQIASSAATTSKTALSDIVADVERARKTKWSPFSAWMRNELIPGGRHSVQNAALNVKSTVQELTKKVKDKVVVTLQRMKESGADGDWINLSAVRGAVLGFAGAMALTLVFVANNEPKQPLSPELMAALAMPNTVLTLLSTEKAQNINEQKVGAFKKDAADSVMPLSSVARRQLLSDNRSITSAKVGMKDTPLEPTVIPSTNIVLHDGIMPFAALTNNSMSTNPETHARQFHITAKSSPYMQTANAIICLEHDRIWDMDSSAKDGKVLVQNTSVTRSLAVPSVKESDSELPGLQPEEWVLAQSPDNYVIQVLAAKKREVVNRFLEGDISSMDIAYYRRRNDQDDWYVLVSGVYGSYDSAKLASLSLPEQALKAKPWIRPVADVQQDIRQAQRIKSQKSIL